MNIENKNSKSPKYYGKLACSYKLNDTEIGYDKDIWQVAYKNNRYVWIRQTEDVLEMNNLNNKNKYIEIENKELNKDKKKKKYTQYNEFLEIKMKELKETETQFTPKELFSFAVKEWHTIKNDKEKLNNYLYKK